MGLNLLPESLTCAQLVERLGDVHRYLAAYERLLALGAEAATDIRAALAHPDPLVREDCCKLLDHLMDDDTIVDLIGMLDHPEPKVRIAARDHDGDPAVRKKAAWYLPGGAVHRRGH
jgi:HEAT repeat protein